MKKYLLVSIFFLVPCFVFAQKKSIDGFMDIPFGSDSVTVKAAILAKGGVRVDSLCKKDQLVFTNFSFSDRSVSSLNIYFVNNKAYDAFFHFTDTESNILSYYDNLAHDITAVYGKPTEVDNAPEYNPSVKIRKLQAGNIFVKSVWVSKNKNVILLHIIPVGQSLDVVLRYEDSNLWDLKASQRRSDL